ncbi:ACT domain-containing protein [Sinorhizobium sp. BG8]|uniref:ACT domain-containing protein n=1 Tax=Sinorhizobium sp. BG8 TaxID=2613773 RepID=UPI00193CD0AA|nr:ACT domain-containing protein [Sinorhizobium sp. BG8]QRM56059.1 ACT domain-containing protein [Sinorhizobium sp. BG8]
MNGITDLDRLLAELEPSLAGGEFVFCTVPHEDVARTSDPRVLCYFREREGLTLILPAEVAVAEELAASAPMRMITLTVHSSLEAVGLTAAVSAALTGEGVSANVVAAYHHDHIFVPAADAERALEALRRLSRR